MRRAWDVQWMTHRWFLQLGVHVDHKAPYVALHLPCLIVLVGRIPQPGLRR